MMTKVEYRKTFERICNERKTCYGCFLEFTCKKAPNDTIDVVLDFLNRLELWAYEHPIKTNRDKFEEIYGFRPTNEDFKGALPCNEEDPAKKLDCITRMGCVCGDCTWWDDEYKEPEKG